MIQKRGYRRERSGGLEGLGRAGSVVRQGRTHRHVHRGQGPGLRFILGTRGLLGSDKGLIGFSSTQYDSAAAAQAAAEDELVRILAELDAVTASLRAAE